MFFVFPVWLVGWLGKSFGDLKSRTPWKLSLIHGTHSDREPCPACSGPFFAGLRREN
jgi:hypothetical protein